MPRFPNSDLLEKRLHTSLNSSCDISHRGIDGYSGGYPKAYSRMKYVANFRGIYI